MLLCGCEARGAGRVVETIVTPSALGDGLGRGGRGLRGFLADGCLRFPRSARWLPFGLDPGATSCGNLLLEALALRVSCEGFLLEASSGEGSRGAGRGLEYTICTGFRLLSGFSMNGVGVRFLFGDFDRDSTLDPVPLLFPELSDRGPRPIMLPRMRSDSEVCRTGI